MSPYLAGLCYSATEALAIHTAKGTTCLTQRKVVEVIVTAHAAAAVLGLAGCEPVREALMETGAKFSSRSALSTLR